MKRSMRNKLFDLKKMKHERLFYGKYNQKGYQTNYRIQVYFLLTILHSNKTDTRH